jgi:hypothetical protein
MDFSGHNGNDGSTNFVPLSPFIMKQGKGIIDIWWLYDDGGNSTSLQLTLAINNRLMPKIQTGIAFNLPRNSHA